MGLGGTDCGEAILGLNGNMVGVPRRESDIYQAGSTIQTFAGPGEEMNRHSFPG